MRPLPITSLMRTPRPFNEDDEEPLEQYLWTCSTRPPFSPIKSRETRSRLDKRDRERPQSPSHDTTLYRHNVATIYAAMEDEIGPPTSQSGSSKARALSHALALPQMADAPVLPLSPFLVQRPRDLSESLAGIDTEGEESSDRGLKLGRLIQGHKFKMGWYKIPRSSFDYAPASIDTVLMDRGVKEPEEWKFSTALRRTPGHCPSLAPSLI